MILPAESINLGKMFARRVQKAIKKYPNLKSPDLNRKELLENEVKAINFNDFTEDEWKILADLSKSFSKNKSLSDILKSQSQVAAGLKYQLSGEKLQKMYDVISVLYYGTKEIQKTLNSNEAFGGREGPLSSAELATVWEIALVEPSPIGEIVAFLLTVGYVSYFIVTRADCIEKYVDCKDYSAYPSLSGACLNYCIVQGYWNCN